MKKFFLLLAVMLAAMQLSAAPVDASAALSKAKSYLANELYAGKFMAPSATDPVLLKTEFGETNKPVYYIYNTSTTFLVVAGDDRAEEILMVGDRPLKDINNLPPAMQDILNQYKGEIQFLHENPDVKVSKMSTNKDPMLRAVTYGPLLTAEWDQEAPYYNQCKFTYNNRTYQCLTGCPATSAAMVMYFWKYPAGVGALASYTSTLDIGYNQSVNYTYPALDATTFDWANMKDKYNSYTTAQGTAVATLMRYIGQAEQMMYGTSAAGGSGIYTNETNKVVNMFKNWGYKNTVAVKYKSSYSATNWANLLIAELAAGRPMIYNGVSSTGGGHAFNVDGYRDSDSKWHVNFGWSGDGNSWYAMNSFSYGGYTFSQDQQAVIGIEPPSTDPALTVNPTSLSFSGNVGETYTRTFTVSGVYLTGNVTVSVSGDNVYSVSPTTLTAAEASAGATITVTYAPTAAGTQTGTVTVASSGADSKTVSLTGTSVTVAKLAVNPTSLSFSGTAGQTYTKTFTVTGTDLNGDVTITKSGNAAFTVSPTTLTKAQAQAGATVTVTYAPTSSGSTAGTITVASSGADSKTVSLTGTATASTVPTITVNPTSLTFSSSVGVAVTQTFTVTGTNLTSGTGSGVFLSVEGAGFTIDKTAISRTAAASGATVTVTYKPTTAGTHTGTVTLTSNGAETKTVTLTGTATGPTITANPTSLTFAANTGETVTNTFTVSGSGLSGNLSLALNDANGAYSITPTTLTAAQAMAGATVTVTYAPTAFGSHNATVTISGTGASPVTVDLNGTATLAKFTPVMLAAVEDYINLTKFRADWTDQTPAANVASYTLEVSAKPEEPAEPVLLHSLSGSAYTGSYADITLPAPWGGVSVRGGNGAIYTKNNYNGVATGYITYTIPEGYTNATFTLLIKSGTGSYGAGNFTVASTQTAAVGHTFTGGETYTWQVVASSGEQITIYSTDSNYSPDINLIAVYSGVYTPAKLNANETGDANYRLITGITDRFYTVENLTAEGTFLYKVKAIYVDGTESDWSNIEEVTLFQNGHGYEPGDLDHSGAVNTGDLSMLINYLLTNDASTICTICADVNQDGSINIKDITDLINTLINQ